MLLGEIGTMRNQTPDKPTSVMKVIRPLEAHTKAVSLFKRLDQLLQRCKNDVRAASQDLDNESIREIQGNRYEIFIEALGKSSVFFDSLCEKLVVRNSPACHSVAAVRKTLLGYCTEAAGRDDRTSNLQLGNFSIIVNYDPVEDQQPHIDLLSPNHQFGCLLTNNTPGTKAYQPGDSNASIATASDLQRLYPDLISDGIVKAIQNHPPTSQLLQGFGNVLSPTLHEVCAAPELPTGTVLSLPGSVVHAGPAALSYRAILFFSGWPQDSSSIAEYDPDTQYFSGLLLCDMLLGIWADLCYEDRVRFLTHLIDTMLGQHYPPKYFVRHLRPGPLCDTCARACNTKSKRERTELIAQASHQSMDESSETLHLITDRLWTHFEGDVWRIRVFRRETIHQPTGAVNDIAVCLQYIDRPTEWEGTGDRPYRLVMDYDNDDKTVFDGTNGTLYCDDGEEVPCFQKTARKRPR